MFAVHIKGESHRTTCFQHKSTITGDIVEFYPERGLITIEGIKRRSGVEFYNRVSRREFLIRAMALSLEIKHMKYGGEKEDQRRLLDVMIMAAKRAGTHGDPFNQRHVDDILKERNKSRVRVGYNFDSGMPPVPKADPMKPAIPLAVLGRTETVVPKPQTSPIIIATR
jgi:hypothetical protein